MLWGSSCFEALSCFLEQLKIHIVLPSTLSSDASLDAFFAMQSAPSVIPEATAVLLTNYHAPSALQGLPIPITEAHQATIAKGVYPLSTALPAKLTATNVPLAPTAPTPPMERASAQ